MIVHSQYNTGQSLAPIVSEASIILAVDIHYTVSLEKKNDTRQSIIRDERYVLVHLNISSVTGTVQKF